MNDYIIIICTINDYEKAKEISKKLIEEKLVACSNIIPKIISMYRWQDKICEDTEYLILLKAKSSGFEAVKTKIIELHPYEVPEIIAINIRDGAADYLNWLKLSLK